MPRRANGEGARRPRGAGGGGVGPSASPSSPAVLLSSPGRSSATPLASQRTNLYGMPSVSVSTSSLSRPDASLAPHLASSETHLGRMTLTAPDNMLRRQAQERERERKARKAANAARRGGIRVAGGAAAGPSEPRPASAASSRSISPRRRQQRRASRDEQQSSRDDDLVRASEASSSSRPRMARSNSGPAVLPQEVSRPAAPLVETQSVPTQLAPRASLRRHNIYHEIAHLGLPGVESSSDYSDEEDGGRGASSTSSPPPPPFPQDSRRPETPPRAPPPPREPGHDAQEGEVAWTEEDQQRWIEYRRRVPDSPPPAFVSEGEEDEAGGEVVQADIEQARPSSPSAASESSQDADAVSDEERRAWDLDAQRGLTFEERIHRLELRRRRKEGMAEQRWREERANEVAVREMLEKEAREAQAQAQAQASAERGMREEVRAESPAATSTTAAPAAVTATRTPSAASPAEQLVTLPSETPATASPAPVPPQPVSRIVTDGALSVPSLQVTRTRTHARSTSDQRSTATSSRSKATAIRPRPSSESHSRFRDDASAAAERRRLAWGGAAPLAGLQVPTAPAPRSRDEMDAHRASMTRATSEGTVTSLQDLQAQRRGRAGDDEDSASTASSDSADAWEAESKAFEAMRGAAEQTAAVADESDDDESVLSPAPQMIRSPGQIMRESLPKAPPPLALGRSRGAGVAYDASDSDSSRDGDDIDDDSDDSLSPDEAEVQRHVNEKWRAQDPMLEAAASRRSLDSSAASPAQASSSKGKQPERANGQAFQPSRHAASDPNLPGAYAQPAGYFEPDSSSSASLSDDDAREVAVGLEPQKKSATATAMGAQIHPSRSSSSSLWRGRMPGEPPANKRIEVNDRLKGLFDAPLAESSTQQGPARRSSQRSLRSVEESARIDGGHSSGDRSSTSRQQVQPPPPPPRNVATSSGLPDEQQLRREALLDIARLQTGSQADRNSLAALEKLLAGSLRGEQGDQAAAAQLPFTNRQSSYAPLPRQSRLPQITDATRHFPPSRAPTVSDSSTSGAARVRPPVPGSRISALRARFEGGQEGSRVTEDDGNDASVGPQVPARRASPAVISRSGAVRRVPPPVPPRVRATSTTNTDVPATVASPTNGPVPATRRPPPPPPTSASSAMVAAPELPPRPVVPLTMPTAPYLASIDDTRLVSSADDHTAGATLPPIVVVPPHTGRRPLPTPPSLLPREEPVAGPSAATPCQLRTPTTTNEPQDVQEDGATVAAEAQPTTQNSSPESPPSPPRRQPSLGITDLDVLASRLDLEGSHFDELAALQEFLGPAESSAYGVLSPHEMASLPCGPVYIESRRVTREGKTKSKLACLGLRVERCTVCMSQFKEAQMAVVLGCLHVFHEEPCAKTWFRTRSRACPTCRIEAVERVAAP